MPRRRRADLTLVEVKAAARRLAAVEAAEQMLHSPTLRAMLLSEPSKTPARRRVRTSAAPGGHVLATPKADGSWRL